MSVMDSGSNLLFLAVARRTDRVVVATFAAQPGDVNRGQYLKTVSEVLLAPEFAGKVQAGARFRLAGPASALSFTADDERVYFCVASSEYPERLVFPMLQQLAERFAPLAAKSATCAENGLSSKAKRVMSEVVAEWDDPAAKDKVAQVQAKVADVRLTMESNIQGMLSNMETADKIHQDTVDLESQAAQFSKQATDLKKRELWQSRKMTLLIVLIVAIILTVLVLSLVK